MSDSQNPGRNHEIEEVRRHVRRHKVIALGLVAGTVLTIWASRMPLDPSTKIAVSLGIACIQGFLILGFFMNLVSEKKMIYAFLIFTAVFFVAQMAVTVWARLPQNGVHL